MRGHDQFRSASAGAHNPPAGLHEWALGLPWVVERPPAPEMPGVRMFAVDCDPLGLRQLWLVTGLTRGAGIVVIVPTGLGEDLETIGIARAVAPMPAGNVIARVSDDADCTDIETIVLRAYASAMSWGIRTKL